MRAVHSRLGELSGRPGEFPGEAVGLFKVLWRLKEHRTGPPHYPELSRRTVQALLTETEAVFERGGLRG
jgi:hypothetical protein